MRGLVKRGLGLTLIGLLWTGISPCNAQDLGESAFVLPSDAQLDECLDSACGDIIRRLTEQSEQDAADLKLLRIEIDTRNSIGALEAGYWKKQYESERGSVVDRAIKNYGPAVLFVLGVWAGSRVSD